VRERPGSEERAGQGVYGIITDIENIIIDRNKNRGVKP
jgi:hypothetical protein